MNASLALPSGPLSLHRVRIMGILNATPDSFYDGGRYIDRDVAFRRARTMVAEGADIIDVGGEKAGPGAPVTVEEEIKRVVPLIEMLRRDGAAPISIDTYKPEVAAAAMDAGADMINSIDGFSDHRLRRVAAATAAAVIIMHIQGQPRVANPDPEYGDVAEEVRAFLLERVEACLAAGISADRIVIDPGPGFGKTTQHDLEVLAGLRRLTELPYPVALAVSRKKFIGDVLGAPVESRLEGSLAVATWGVLHGARIVRTHDVAATVQACRMAEAVLDPYGIEEHV